MSSVEATFHRIRSKLLVPSHVENYEESRSESFTTRQKKSLEDQGYIIYRTAGFSMADIQQQGFALWSTISPEVEHIRSFVGEVAIHPGKFFIPGSNEMTFVQQQRMLDWSTNDLQYRTPGVAVVRGGAPDVVEVTSKHFRSTGERLFGRTYDFDWTNTSTVSSNGQVVMVGYFHSKHGLRVSDMVLTDRHDAIWTARFVVPLHK